jgi:hypothetical protein
VLPAMTPGRSACPVPLVGLDPWRSALHVASAGTEATDCATEARSPVSAGERNYTS